MYVVLRQAQARPLTWLAAQGCALVRVSGCAGPSVVGCHQTCKGMHSHSPVSAKLLPNQVPQASRLTLIDPVGPKWPAGKHKLYKLTIPKTNASPGEAPT